MNSASLWGLRKKIFEKNLQCLDNFSRQRLALTFERGLSITPWIQDGGLIYSNYVKLKAWGDPRNGCQAGGLACGYTAANWANVRDTCSKMAASTIHSKIFLLPLKQNMIVMTKYWPTVLTIMYLSKVLWVEAIFCSKFFSFLVFQTRNLVIFLELAVKVESPNYGVQRLKMNFKIFTSQSPIVA